MHARKISLIAHNLRSCHNVGSLLRTADGLGLDSVYLTGYTPYPLKAGDTRLPHEAQKLHKQISKTALGAEASMEWAHDADVLSLVKRLQQDGYQVIALEQSPKAIPLLQFHAPQKVALVVGREVEGVEPAVLEACNKVVEIPMYGKKESFNVVQAAAMALYHFKFVA
jgi:23S rRNA (guanosine2251-2'-O)-methyltransferase